MWPILLGLGLLAANRYGHEKYEQETGEKYRGLLGTAPTPMGPPDESGRMGSNPGTGLLADPKDLGRQLEFAAGVAGMRGQRAAGLQMLNAAFGRVQEEANREQAGQQFERQFTRQGEQFAQGQENWQKAYDAGRADALASQNRADRDFGFRTEEAGRQAEQWRQSFGLSQRADARAERQLGLLERGPEGPGGQGPQAKLPAGWEYVPGPAGEAVAAPVRGTTDWSKGVAGAESLQSAVDRLGQMQDLIEGKETMTLAGRKVRLGGQGTETSGENAARYSVLRGQIVADMGKLRDAGVLQEGEYDRMEAQLPDPSSYGSYFRSNKTMGAGYAELQEQFRKKLQSHFVANPWLIPAVPKGFEPVKH